MPTSSEERGKSSVMTNRADPLGDISDFAPAPPRPKPPVATVRKVAAANGFTPSRPAPRLQQRRYRTGRNIQLNLKVTAATMAKFTALADREGWSLAETLEQLLEKR